MKRLAPPLLLLLALALLAAPPPAVAQGAMVRGMVVDEEGEPLPDVTVTFNFQGETRGRKTWSQETDKKGGFVRVGLPAGPFEITFEKEGFRPYGIQIGLSLGGLSEICSNAPRPGEPCEEIVLEKAPVVVSIPGGTGEAEAGVESDAEKAAQLGATYQAAVDAIREQQWDAAETALKEVLEQIPGQPVVHFNLGHVYRQKGDLAAAEGEFQRAMELDPDSSDAYVALAVLYEDQGKGSESLRLLTEAAPRFESDAKFQTALGAAAMNVGQEGEAEAAFTKAVALDPAEVQVHYYLATLALNRGKTDDAIAHLETFVAGVPADAPNADVARSLLEALKTQQD
jgi:cytochrome c-type biogenesis protein CcmH/NrfG